VIPPGEATDPAKLAEPKPSPDAKVPGAVPVDEKTYVIGAEDTLVVSVYQNPAVGCQCMVRPDGKITLHFIGDVQAAGLTPEQLGKDIAGRLNGYLVDPVVSVSLAGVHSKKYYLQGQVRQPGRHDLIMPTTVMEALVGAGGFLDFADTKHIVIARGDKRLTFNYNDVVKGKNLKQNILLEDGDMILVK
jgi:polysaccharide export outer membrane protein